MPLVKEYRSVGLLYTPCGHLDPLSDAGVVQGARIYMAADLAAANTVSEGLLEELVSPG